MLAIVALAAEPLLTRSALVRLLLVVHGALVLGDAMENGKALVAQVALIRFLARVAEAPMHFKRVFGDEQTSAVFAIVFARRESTLCVAQKILLQIVNVSMAGASIVFFREGEGEFLNFRIAPPPSMGGGGRLRKLAQLGMPLENGKLSEVSLNPRITRIKTSLENLQGACPRQRRPGR